MASPLVSPALGQTLLTAQSRVQRTGSARLSALLRSFVISLGFAEAKEQAILNPTRRDAGPNSKTTLLGVERELLQASEMEPRVWVYTVRVEGGGWGSWYMEGFRVSGPLHHMTRYCQSTELSCHTNTLPTYLVVVVCLLDTERRLIEEKGKKRISRQLTATSYHQAT